MPAQIKKKSLHIWKKQSALMANSDSDREALFLFLNVMHASVKNFLFWVCISSFFDLSNLHLKKEKTVKSYALSKPPFSLEILPCMTQKSH